jgi:Tfp pilus assembly protein PilV
MKQGTSIIEVVIAAALISVAIIAALSLANYSQKQNTYARDLAEATEYTTQAADWIRTQRDSLGWATIADKATTDDVGNLATYCLNSIPTAASTNDFTDIAGVSCVTGTYIQDTFFQREMLVDTSSVANGILKITIQVTWFEEVERQSTLEMELSQWK